MGTSTATIVITDMVGSTSLRARLGEDRADELRSVHDRLLTARVEANGGRVLKGTGDGLLATFTAASSGLTAAVEIQQAIASYNRRPDALTEIWVRVGISGGDVSWEGGDCFGTPVIESARLEAAAGAGQILCSELVRLLAHGRGGHEFRSIGFLDLKGLPEPIAVCEVIWEPEPDRPPLPLPLGLAADAARGFVSRRRELEAAERMVADPERQRLGVLLILGEPGIGKTRLAAEIATRVHAAGGVVLFGRCDEELSIPYQPFLEALRWHVRHLPDLELADRMGDAPGELSRLVPEIRGRLIGAEPSPSTSAEIEQHRLFEGVRAWLAAAGGGRSLVVVLDDVHWATRPTISLLGHVARSAEPARALVVCTARDTSPDSNEALAALVEDLSRRGTPCQRLGLSGLDVEAVAELIASVEGRSPGDRLSPLAGELHGETAGNPLYLDALLDALPDKRTGQRSELPVTLAESISRRVGRLPKAAIELLRVASVAGLDFELSVVAGAAGCKELDALEVIEGAQEAGLIQEADINRYRFRHALVRSALRDGLSRSRRARLHGAVGEALETVHADQLDEYAAALAHHFSEAVAVGGAPKAYRYRLLAAERASHLSYDEAVEAYGQALELLDQVDGTDPLARCQVLFAQGEAQRRCGDLHGSRITLRRAADEATARQAPELRAQAAIAFEETSMLLGSSAESLALLEPADAALPAGATRLQALTAASLSRAYRYAGRLDECGERSQEARALAGQLDDPVTSVTVLTRTSPSYFTIADAAMAAVQWMEVVKRAREIGDDESCLSGTHFALWATAQLGDLALFDQLFSDYTRLTEQVRQPTWSIPRQLYRSLRAFLDGDLEGAEARLEEAERLWECLGWAREGLYAVGMFAIRREQGRLTELATALRTLVRLNPPTAIWGPGLAALYAELGMLDEASCEFERLSAQYFSGLPVDGSQELCISLLAEVCNALGDAGRAPGLIELLLPCEGRLLVFPMSAVCLGPADRLLGMLASTSGRGQDAERWHHAGLELAEHIDSPLWRAHCLYDYAVHLGGARPAREMLTEAAGICERYHLVGLGERVARLSGS
ncbi:MAG: ATP-binding protein [Pseudonocardiaceae bacterium]